MRMLFDMDTIQIEITNACINACSNCTRFCGHQKPYFMSFKRFQEALDSMIGYPNMTGFMGGEPLLHPEFEKFCDYALSKIPRGQLGLWSCFPKGFEKYRETICRTFGNIFLNDHTRTDIYHCPVLVAAEEMVEHRGRMFMLINECWLQNAWSAAINPNGAFFCEIAASMSILFGTNKGWRVEKEWWMRTPKDYKDQIEEYCPKCGCAMPLPRRISVDRRDDISPGNLKRLKGRSLKIDKGEYLVNNLQPSECPEEMASYKDQGYRDIIAARYGIFLILNEKGFLAPYLKQTFCAEEKNRKMLFDIYKEKYAI
jgi:hypothetical protein